MTPSRESLDLLFSKASKLNEETENLNSIFLSLQDQLRAANVGVSAWINSELIEPEDEMSEHGDRYTDGWTVGYAKVGRDWCLAARTERWIYTLVEGGREYTDAELVTSGPIELVRAPRSVRAEAAAKLDDLVQMITARVDQFLENIESAKRTAAISSGTEPPTSGLMGKGKKRTVLETVFDEPPKPPSVEAKVASEMSWAQPVLRSRRPPEK